MMEYSPSSFPSTSLTSRRWILPWLMMSYLCPFLMGCSSLYHWTCMCGLLTSHSNVALFGNLVTWKQSCNSVLFRLVCENYIVVYLLLPSTTVVAERLCFHRCLSVHTPCQAHPRKADTPRPGRHPPGRQTPLLAGRHPSWQADTPYREDTPTRWLLQRTVRILLECILVWKLNASIFFLYSK